MNQDMRMELSPTEKSQEIKGNENQNPSIPSTNGAPKRSPELNAAPPFTRGPWKVERNARLEIISTVEPYKGCGWGQAVAHVYRAGKMNGTPYRMPADANARLIAAAPALYAALSLLLLRHIDASDECPVVKQARAALELANGQRDERDAKG